jgi:hypothetical protein
MSEQNPKTPEVQLPARRGRRRKFFGGLAIGGLLGASAATASSSQNAVARSRWALCRELSRTGAGAAEVSCGLWLMSRDLSGAER